MTQHNTRTWNIPIKDTPATKKDWQTPQVSYVKITDETRQLTPPPEPQQS